MGRQAKSPWDMSLGEGEASGVAGDTIDPAGFKRLQESAGIKGFVLKRTARTAIESRLFWCRSLLQAEACSIPASNVLHALQQMAQGQDRPAVGEDTRAWIAAERAAQAEATARGISLAAAVDVIRKSRPKAGKRGGQAKNTGVNELIAQLLIEFACSGGVVSGTGFNINPLNGTPYGPFFAFVKCALSFVPEAAHLTDHAVAGKIRVTITTLKKTIEKDSHLSPRRRSQLQKALNSAG